VKGSFTAGRTSPCAGCPWKVGNDGACVGYLLSEHAFDNFAVRMAAADDHELFASLTAGGPLHERYDDMAAALVEHWGFV
jgi:hypothetical protein